MLGRFNDEPFVCTSKSGGQNLWLPFMLDKGLKVFHPKGFSGTLEKAKTHYEAQKFLAEHQLAPKPIHLLELNVSFVKSSDEMPPWNCYGIMMKRVLNGGTSQILKNLEGFGVDRNQQTRQVVDYCCRSADALTLSDYAILCRYFGVPEANHTREILNDFQNRIPDGFKMGPDFLTPTNIVLDENGQAKVVDCDICSI